MTPERQMEQPLQQTAKLLNDKDGQFVLVPASLHLQATEYWFQFDDATGVITLNPKLSPNGEVSEAQRLRDIQAMTEIIAAKVKLSQ